MEAVRDAPALGPAVRLLAQRDHHLLAIRMTKGIGHPFPDRAIDREIDRLAITCRKILAVELDFGPLLQGLKLCQEPAYSIAQGYPAYRHRPEATEQIAVQVLDPIGDFEKPPDPGADPGSVLGDVGAHLTQRQELRR